MPVIGDDTYLTVEIIETLAQLYYDAAYHIRHRPGLKGLVHSAPYLCCAVSCLWVSKTELCRVLISVTLLTYID